MTRESDRAVSSNQTSRLANPLPGMTKDGWLLLTTAAIRSLAYGALSVVLGLYLAELGLGPGTIGVIFTSALVGGAALTMLVATFADRYGRKRTLLLGAGLMALSGIVFLLTSNPVVLGIAAAIGATTPSGREVGPLLSVEQAVLPQTIGDRHRTSIFAAYNIVGYFFSAIGALAVGIPGLLGVVALDGYRVILFAYVIVGLGLLATLLLLSPAIEAAPVRASARIRRFGLHTSRGIVFKLSSLYAIDSFAGGFVVQGLVSYWFNLRWGIEAGGLGLVFFGANLMATLSFLLAVPLARRFGLLNTMVFTHLPSNVLLILVPFMPGAGLAIGVFLLRNFLSQMDMPTRQSYLMAVVADDERSAAAGFTTVARNAAASVAPAFAGATLAIPALGLPFLIGGGLKVVYDLALLAMFRNIRPPEEEKPGEGSLERVDAERPEERALR